jgi:predicted RNase H-like nuclease
MSMFETAKRRSALPYQVLAGVEPCTGGWLVAPGNLQGITLAPQPAFVVPTLADVLDYRPSFAVVALHAPIGTTDKPSEPRLCDVAARRVLGRRAAAAVLAPSRVVLQATSLEEAQEIDPAMDIVRWRLLRKASEALSEVQSWRQRSVWEVNPELAFLHMNGGVPLTHAKRSQLGKEERLALLEAKMPGFERVFIDRKASVRSAKLIDAAADLWTARRIVARAITRLSDPPAWDADGIRMDIVY